MPEFIRRYEVSTTAATAEEADQNFADDGPECGPSCSEAVEVQAIPGKTLAQILEETLWPERFPPGHPRHDPDHVHWSGYDADDLDAEEGEDPEPFQWDSETIEWVADIVTAALKDEAAQEVA